MPVEPLLPQAILDYTQMDRQDMLVRLQYLCNQKNPAWRDFSTAHPENLLLEAMAFMGEIFRGTMEERVRQFYWATLTERLAAIRLGRPSGFRLTAGSAPSVDITIGLPGGAAPTVDVRIPIQTDDVPYGLNIRTLDPSDPKLYHLDYNVHVEGSSGVWKDPTDNSLWLILAAGATSVTATFKGSFVHRETFEALDNVANQELLLTNYPFVEGSAVISADGESYTELDDPSFLYATPEDKVFLARVDSEERGRIVFGSGINGSIPVGTIEVVYESGGGEDQEVEANTNWTVDDPVYDADGQPVTLVLTNAAASTSATDPMTVEEAKVLGPLHERVKERAVIDDDFEIAAIGISGIARAALITSDDDSTLEEDYARLLVVGKGDRLDSGRYAPASSVSASKLGEIQTLFAEDGTYESLMGVSLSIVAVDADYFRDISVACRIYKESGFAGAAVKTNIEEALKDWFAVLLADGTPNPNVNFGCKLLGSDGNPDYLVPWSKIVNAINDAEGVRMIAYSGDNVLLEGNRASVTLEPMEWPRLDTANIAIYDMDQGGVQL